MTLYAIAATLLLAALARHTVTVRRQRDRAQRDADTNAKVSGHYQGKSIDQQFHIRDLETDLAVQRALNAELVATLADLDGRVLPMVPRPTSDQAIPAKPYSGPAIVIDLPTLKAPVKRARKVVGVK